MADFLIFCAHKWMQGSREAVVVTNSTISFFCIFFNEIEGLSKQD